MSHAQLLEGAVLQVAHDGVELHHGVGDRCAGGEGDALAAGDLVQVLALHEHVRALLRVGLGDARHVAHLGIEKGILVKVALIDEEPVHTQLLEGHDIVLALLVIELCKAYLQCPAGFLHLLDGVIFPSFIFERGDGILDIIDLPPDGRHLTLAGQGDALKLAVADDNCVVVTGRDAGAELFPVGRLKVFLRCDKDICPRIEAKEITSPLLDQVVGDDIETLLGKAQAFRFHACGNHEECLARTYAMGEKRVVSVQDVGGCVLLVVHQGDFRRHPDKADMGAIIFSGTDAVE